MHNKPNLRKSTPVSFGPGDEVAYAMGKGMRYGTVVRLIGSGEQAAVEIQFEDGSREIHRARDRALSLLRRVSGASATQEEQGWRGKLHDPDIDAVRRSDVRRRW